MNSNRNRLCRHRDRGLRFRPPRSLLSPGSAAAVAAVGAGADFVDVVGVVVGFEAAVVAVVVGVGAAGAEPRPRTCAASFWRPWPWPPLRLGVCRRPARATVGVRLAVGRHLLGPSLSLLFKQT